MSENINFIAIEQYAHDTFARLALDHGLIGAGEILQALKIQNEKTRVQNRGNTR